LPILRQMTEIAHIAPVPAVELADGRVVIHELAADGTLAALVVKAVEDGREPEEVVRQVLEVGAAVLLHGANKGTVDAVSSEVDRLLSALNERSSKLEVVRRARERIAARGFGFEDELGATLETLFASHEDVLEATGTVKGVAEEKVGDFVLTVNPRDTGGHHRRVVFEAKDRPLSLAKALAELDAAMLNRSADVGVLVFARVAQAQTALKGRSLRTYPGNRIVVVWEQETQGDLALEVAATLARALACTAAPEDAKLNRRGLATRIERLINVIERAETIRRGLRSAQRGLDDAGNAYSEMSERAMELLLELQDRL
jgi:hypothetical protein